jgi:branched-chain amino acid transport system permease protein
MTKISKASETPYLLAVLAFSLVFPLIFTNAFLINVVVTVLIFAFAGQAWNILGGYGGQFSLGHAIFFGAGAYGVTLFYLLWNVNFLLGIVIGVAWALVLALAIALVSFRLRGIFFSMVTLAATFVMELLIGEYTYVNIQGFFEGGESGFSLPPFLTQTTIYYILVVLIVFTLFLTYWISKNRLGYSLVAVREDEGLAVSLGINSYRVKTIATCISAALTAIAGALFAIFVAFVQPYSLISLTNSFNIMVGPMLGGAGTVFGPVLGALILFLPTTYITTLTGAMPAGLPYALSGVVILLIAVFLPHGIRKPLEKVKKWLS